MFQDLRYGLRILLRSPGSSLVAIIALALGIGANTAIFSLVEAVLLRPLPYHQPDRLVQVWEDARQVGFPHNTPAPANFFDWKAQNQVFEDLAASKNATLTLTGDGDPEAVLGRAMTANMFPLLGVRPALGRVFTAEEDRPGGPPVAVISYGLWQRRFGGDRAVVGRAVLIDGRQTTLIGVMPRDFVYPKREHEMWVPIAFTPEDAARRGTHYLQVVGRLRPGISIERARGDMTAIAGRLERDHPDSNKAIGAVLVPLRDEVVGDVRAAVFILLAAVGCVLLIACANVANLLLSRATARRREIAVRVALGARRGRVIRQLLTESVLLSVAGGVLGLGVALWSYDLLATFVPMGTGATVRLALDGRVLAFTALVSILCGVVFGLAPALTASRQDLADQLKARGNDVAASGRLRGALVIAEVALSFLLLVGAGLMVQAFLRVRSLDPGFRPEHVLTVRTLLPSPKYDDRGRRVAFYDEVLARVSALPGVVSAGYTSFLPFTNRGGTQGFVIDGHAPLPPGVIQDANYRVVSPGYHRTMGIALRAGRLLEARDGQDAMPVVLVNQALAAKFFPGEDAIGKRLRLGGPDSGEPWLTVVGIVGDVRQMSLEAEGRAEMYVPHAQVAEHDFFSPKDLAILAAGDETALADAVRQAIWKVDPAQPVASVRPMSALVDQEVANRNVQATLLAGFAALALVLASLGIYGVLSYTVALRRREIGIRMALGAPGARVVRMVVAQGLRLTLGGIAIGLVLALGLTRALSALLYGVSASDPLTYAAVGAALTTVAALASYIPARQAARVDPMVTLQAE